MVVISTQAIKVNLVDGAFGTTIPTTDNADLLPSGWAYVITFALYDPLLLDQPAQSFSALIPSSYGSTVDISQLIPAPGNVPPSNAYVSSVNGMTGNVVLSTGGINPPAGDLGGTSDDPTVVSTHLSAALPVNQGGTGETSAQAALNNLAGAVTSGEYLRGNGSNVALSAIDVADVPTLNQNTTGTAGSANALQSATTTVSVVSATAPSAGQVLSATSSTAADWADPQPFGLSLSGFVAQNLGLSGLLVNALVAAASVFYGSLVYIPVAVQTSKITFEVTDNTDYIEHGYGALLSTAGTTVLATADFEATVTSFGWYGIPWSNSPATVEAGLYYLGVAIAWSTEVALAGQPVSVMQGGNIVGAAPYRFVTGSVTITSSFPASVTLAEQTLLGVPYLAMY